MSNTATPRLSLPYLAASQAQKYVTLNQAMAVLDGLVQTTVQSRKVAAEPAVPGDGQIWMLPAGATGADWAGRAAGTLMRYEAGGWSVLPAPLGMMVYLVDEAIVVVNSATGWTSIAPPVSYQNIPLLGVGATASASNPLTVNANGSLFSATTPQYGGTGDVRIYVSKASAANTASVLFQDNFSARAEVGLTVDDQFHINVSADGANWKQALIIDRTSGQVSFPQGATNLLNVGANSALLAATPVSTPGGTGDMRVYVSKAASANTASILFQDNFSGRAEMGLTADDQFHINVSPDGANWTQAVIIDRTTGQVSFPQGAAVAPTTATGFRNRIVNGGFRIWQRGSSFSVSGATSQFTADRWAALTSGGVCTVKPATSGLPSGAPNSLQMTGGPANQGMTITHSVESAMIADLAGLPVTLSGYIYASAAASVTLNLYAFATPDQVATRTQTHTFTLAALTAGWNRFTVTPTLTASATGGIGIEFQFGAIASATRGLAAIQLEPGLVATPFEVRPASLELSMCQRYYYRATPPNWTGVTAGAGTVYRLGGPHPVTMRTTPTVTMSGAFTVTDGVTTASLTALGASYHSPTSAQVDATAALLTVAGRPCFITQTGASWVDVNADL